ncbi:MAG: 7-cyano-7-deazaguanine synthase [Candidatus Heimdallarchaeaceae archaeon]
MSIAIVLFSGGLDSTACLYWALEQYDDILLLSFKYGSKEDEVIQRLNLKFAEIYNLKSRIITLDFLEELSSKRGSKLASSESNLPEFSSFEQLNDSKLTKETANQVWIPARNILFISTASAFADSYKEPVHILFGANKEEAATFPDNSPEFVERMNDAINLGCLNKISVLAPFNTQVKREIIDFLVKKEAKFEYISSCYQVQEWSKEGYPIHCGICESCQRKKRAFQESGFSDPTFYKKQPI